MGSASCCWKAFTMAPTSEPSLAGSTSNTTARGLVTAARRRAVDKRRAGYPPTDNTAMLQENNSMRHEW